MPILYMSRFLIYFRIRYVSAPYPLRSFPYKGAFMRCRYGAGTVQTGCGYGFTPFPCRRLPSVFSDIRKVKHRIRL